MTSRRTTRALGAIAAVAALALTTACGPKAAEPVAAESSTPAPPPPPPTFPWPLTGVETTAPVQRPALAVKIENSVDSRPQTGLNQADMVWEEVVEGGITRFVAVFHSQLPPEIGPIRSVRPMDPPIAAPLRGLFAFSGGQGPFVQAVKDAGLQVISHDAGAPGFYRKTGRYAPHNVYANPADFLAQADANHSADPLEQFHLADAAEQPSALAAGVPTGTLTLKLSGVSHPVWTWSAPDAAWLRAEGSTPATDSDGARLRATNVVVLRVDVVNTRFSDPAGNPVPETAVVGTGEALVATGGQTIAATWSKASESEPVVLTDVNGGPVLLGAGNTWVELVPKRTGAVMPG
ncbi:DUF3048 domain-containing protein [Blastococcus sp. TF02A-30]|uniref:DUF3048 domain-containing protein n=1 Tax=Blastococcus sp. TF02A-30 TaxID=2250580 RepID=UPI000DEA0459|nr:DUF3048 domain-containing protein [Blastococcus sp. TF02A-30]RBY91074.1 DUF3048 domain-containing protein [Blastococcus sp. TF02A-30]